MTERQELQFNKIAHQFGLYTIDVDEKAQCSGYRLLKQMIEEGINPASEEEYLRWKSNPTKEELHSIPNIKYLIFLHPTLAIVLRQNWEAFKLQINS